MTSPTEALLPDVFDIVFAGGGTAACITAGRLAAANPDLRILLLETGSHTDGLPQVNTPGFFMQNLHPNSTTTRVHLMNPTEAMENRALPMHVAKCVGGGSAVNWMMYNRGAGSDYDEWRDTYGNEGWGAKELMPFFKKCETYHVPERGTHGYDGPLKVSYSSVHSNYAAQFLGTMEEYNPECPYTDDPSDFETLNRWHRIPKWIDDKTGKRSDTASAYLYTQKDNKNLIVLTEATVTRVLCEGTRAVGVEYEYRAPLDLTQVELCSARATKLVIVSAGTLGSPAILERSGIGAADVLSKCDVKQLVDLPGVGAEYQDHQMVAQMIVIDDSGETIDFAHRGDQAGIAAEMEEYTTRGTGLLATSGLDAGLKYRPSTEELSKLPPSIVQYFKDEFENKPDRSVFLVGALSGSPLVMPGFPDVKMSLLGGFLHYPKARGYAHIRSKNPSDPLDWHGGFLESHLDMDLHIWIYKTAREYARRHPMYRGEIPQGHPDYPEGSKAGVEASAKGGHAVGEAGIVYAEEDDEAIDAWVRRNVISTWHGMCTCAMKPREQGGVVDSSLNVYGTEALKVVDLSIAPSNVGANTYSTVAMIGEKAADIIAKELGLKL